MVVRIMLMLIALTVSVCADETMPLDPVLVSAVKGFEGYSAKAYWDYRQHSIGYGTRARTADEEIDREVAESRLVEELSKAQIQVDALGLPLTTGQRSALTSLTFNAGASWIRAGLGEAVRAGNWGSARDIFLRYVRANGEVLGGLVRRRVAEASWFEGEMIAAVEERALAAEVTRKKSRVIVRQKDDDGDDEKPKHRRQRRDEDDD